MLKDEDIQIQVGRCEGGGFMTITHLPTGITRESRMLKPGKERHEMLSAIEAELIQRGLMQYLRPDRGTIRFPVVEGGFPIANEHAERPQDEP